MLRLVLLVSVLSQSSGFILDSIFGAPPTTVKDLDLPKYLGRWYQMYASVSVDTLWESGAVCVTADYQVGPNGTVTVLNSERLTLANGTLKVIHGYATPTSEPGKFTVHLENVPIGAAYWVLELGPKTFGPEGLYQYSIVSDNLRATLFVLARDPDVFRAKFQNHVMSFLNTNGFTTIYNKPVVTFHGEDCVYNADHM